MSKMGKNVLKIPGATAADPEEYEHEPAEHAEVSMFRVIKSI
jgi:hypothetical protein